MRRSAEVPGVVAGFGDIATREQLRRAGFSGAQITSAVRSGTITRLRRAWYSLPGVDRERATAIMLGGRIGCLSAAASYRWWRGLDDNIHVSFAPNGNIAKPGRVRFGNAPLPKVVRHWRTHHEPAPGAHAWRESPQETLSQVFRYADRGTAIACADAALHSGLVTADDLARIVARLGDEQREWASYVDAETDSGLETLLRIWLTDMGIPFVFHPSVRRVGEVDFIIGRSLVIETDGGQFHDSESDVRRDARRDHELSLQGYIVIRLRYERVMFDWDSCVRRILNHISRGDHLRRVD